MKKELTCILLGVLFQSLITSSFTNPIVKVPPPTYTIPGHPFCFCSFLVKNQPFWSFGFQPVLLVNFFVPPPLLVEPPPPQLVSRVKAPKADNENNFIFFIICILINFKFQSANNAKLFLLSKFLYDFLTNIFCFYCVYKSKINTQNNIKATFLTS